MLNAHVSRKNFSEGIFLPKTYKFIRENVDHHSSWLIITNPFFYNMTDKSKLRNFTKRTDLNSQILTTNKKKKKKTEKTRAGVRVIRRRGLVVSVGTISRGESRDRGIPGVVPSLLSGTIERSRRAFERQAASNDPAANDRGPSHERNQSENVPVRGKMSATTPTAVISPFGSAWLRLLSGPPIISISLECRPLFQTTRSLLYAMAELLPRTRIQPLTFSRPTSTLAAMYGWTCTYVRTRSNLTHRAAREIWNTNRVAEEARGIL